MAKKKRGDTRKAQRYFYVTPLLYKGEGHYDNLDALSINISGDGIYFQSTLDLPVGHKFILTFKIPGDSEALEAECKVIHRSPSPDDAGYAIGCKIVKVDGLGEDELKKRLMATFGGDPDRLY